MVPDEEVAVVEGGGGEADEDLAGAGLRLGDVLELQPVVLRRVILARCSDSRISPMGSMRDSRSLTGSTPRRACRQSF